MARDQVMVLKSAVTRAVMAGQTITTPREFYQYCVNHLEKQESDFQRSVLFASKTVLDEIRSQKRPRLVGVKGTRKLHSIMPTGLNGLLVTKLLSYFCSSCLKHRTDECQNIAVTSSWQEQSVIDKG